MILRRPYRFLIKYFKSIHIVMFIIFVYFTFMLRNINAFFTNYVKSGNFIYVEKMVKEYVPWYIFILIMLIIVGTLFIYLLMKRKNKPILYYRILILYSAILLGAFVYFYLFFINIKDITYEPLQIVINRDITTFIYITNYFYVGFSFIRGFGFDIKKFNFEQDKKEFEIEESDNEEFEVNVEVDKKDVEAKIRQQRREFGYIVKEHSKILTIISSMIVVIALGYLVINHFIINKIYKQSDTIIIGNMSYKVINSYFTKFDKYGNDLNKNFVIVNINIRNNGENITLSREKFRIKIDDKYYYPAYDYYKAFDDLGNYYDNSTVIGNNSKDDYLLIFNVGERESSKIYLEILKNRDNSIYNVIRLNPTLDKEKTHDYYINEEINISDQILTFNSFEIVNKTSFEYQECQNDICTIYTKTIVPDFNQLILRLNIINSKNLSDSFWENSLGIKYDDKEIPSSQVKVLGRNDDNLYVGVLKGVLTSNNLYAIISVRDVKYNIMLRG